jgi:hypothetical protein
MSNGRENDEVLEIWTFRGELSSVRPETLIGYSVEASDGEIGQVDEATDEIGSCYLIVDTGPWIFGKKVMLPAGVIGGVNSDEEVVHVGLSRDEVKSAPPFNPDRHRSNDYRAALAAYYASTPHEAARALDRLSKTG